MILFTIISLYSTENIVYTYIEAECTKYKPCVGYEYRERSSLCYLIPSSMSCPANYTIGSLSITPASSNDLEAYEQPGTVCYGKNIGNINMIGLYNLLL